MDESEEYKALQKEVDGLPAWFDGFYDPRKLARMQAQATLLLYRSNNRLSESSERLTRRNLLLTVAVFAVAVLQLVGIGVQIWLSVRYPATVITMPSTPAQPSLK